MNLLSSFVSFVVKFSNAFTTKGKKGVSQKTQKHTIVFYKKTLNQGFRNICEKVEITPSEDRKFEEFPDDISLASFDKSDRKFVAVAVKSKYSPKIVNATDSDWFNFEDAFKKHGIEILQLCPNLF